LARDKALELMVGAIVASVGGYFGFNAWWSNSSARTKPTQPPAIEKGWEATVKRGWACSPF